MRIDILTLFPDMFAGPLGMSILGRAVERGHVSIHLHNIRDWAGDRHGTVDDYPYGGGPGMVMKVEPLGAAIEAIRALDRPAPVILLTPQGRLLTQTLLEQWSQRPRMILVCGHYEGIDERARILHVDEEVSIGDYVLTGGELPAMVVVDGVVRLLPGVLDESSLDLESHAEGLLEHPHYTRPAEFAGLGVPAVLLSGHHAEIARWRRREALRRTLLRRPDLLPQAQLSDQDRAFLQSLGWQKPGSPLPIVSQGDPMKPRLLLATNNPGKVREYRAILGGLDIELVTPAELDLALEVEETGQTYTENAVLKARAYARASGLLSLADDSGLEVDALEGAPGVRSARYDGGKGHDLDRYQLLLERLRDVPPEKRGARFRCVIAIASPAGDVHTREGTCEGLIIDHPRGEGGFGYDPVFLLPEKGLTMAELPAEQKNQISHRARAGQRAREVLLELLSREES